MFGWELVVVASFQIFDESSSLLCVFTVIATVSLFFYAIVVVLVLSRHCLGIQTLVCCNNSSRVGCGCELVEPVLGLGIDLWMTSSLTMMM
ncbi:hypothetical protein V6N13_053798 [Hibiscus sabdariffa]